MADYEPLWSTPADPPEVPEVPREGIIDSPFGPVRVVPAHVIQDHPWLESTSSPKPSKAKTPSYGGAKGWLMVITMPIWIWPAMAIYFINGIYEEVTGKNDNAFPYYGSNHRGSPW